MVCGVNGTGKTTTIAKLARLFKSQGKSVLLGAGDTFRAAAVEQLTIWSDRLGVPIVTGEPGSHPASVAYRAVEQAIKNGTDVCIVDTAGRLQTQKNLMAELTKIQDSIRKQLPDAPHEVLLVLDATTGQNGISQAIEVYRSGKLHRHRAGQARRHGQGRRGRGDPPAGRPAGEVSRRRREAGGSDAVLARTNSSTRCSPRSPPVRARDQPRIALA